MANKVLTTARLSKELQDALQADAKRQAIDSAKKRAVGQHVDYETFKNMVSAAHLRPLQDTSKAVKVIAAPSWNFSADGVPVNATQEAKLSARPRDQTLPKPSNADQFLRIWKKQCPEQAAKLQLLLICSSVELHKWFKHGISADLLSEILVVCGYTLKEITAALNATDSMRAPPPSADAESSAWECEPCSTANFVYKLLQVLAGCGRIGLTVKLLNKQAKQTAPTVFNTLQGELKCGSVDACYSAEDLCKLRQVYGC